MPAHKVSAQKAKILHEKIQDVLAESIAHGSTLNVDPENIDGSYYGGGYSVGWRVYDQEKKPCVSCEKPIARLKQAGRSTYFCPQCQK
jgi:formamidopyrimidine-DNA glycosylase